MNLQNWLVLERWIGDSPLSRSKAPDEHDMMYEYGHEELDELLELHRSTYVTRDTFRWLAEQGCNTVRIPIPYYIFGSEHHKSCSKYLNSAFQWAEEFGIGILVELHTTPMGHNGADHCGYTGMCRWHQSEDRVERTLAMLSRVCGRYAGSPAFWGITPLNEPGTKKFVEGLKSKWAGHEKYGSRVLLSTAPDRRFLMQFYEDFYRMARPILGNDVLIVLHDSFYLPAWNKFMTEPNYKNVCFDTHRYVAFKVYGDDGTNMGKYMRVLSKMRLEIAEASKYHPVTVGEWSVASKSIEKDVSEMEALPPNWRKAWYRKYSDAQIDAWDESYGGFLTTLRVSNDSDPRRAPWSFEKCVENGWIDLRHGT